MARYMGVDHVALWTNDMESTVRFYHDVLDMKLVRTLRTGPRVLNNARHYVFDAGRDNYFAFFDGAEMPAQNVPQRLNHMSIKVETEEEFDEAYGRLREHGVETTDIIDRSYGKTFYFHDPNGVRLQIELRTEDSAWNLQGDPDPVPSVRRILGEAQA